jgi:TonB family protein
VPRSSLGRGSPLSATSDLGFSTQDRAEDGSEQPQIKFTAIPFVNLESVVMVLPRCPPFAEAFRIQGQVVLEVTVDQDGGVSDVRSQSGTPLLVVAAETALKQWRYEPSSDLPAGFSVAFEFQLAEQGAQRTKLERSDAGRSPDV